MLEVAGLRTPAHPDYLADPFVFRHEGTYYMVESREGGIFVYRSDTLTNPRRNGVKVWQPASGGWNWPMTNIRRS